MSAKNYLTPLAIWHLPLAARSSILPPLTHKDFFPDQLNKRFLKLYWSVVDTDNTTLRLIWKITKYGIIMHGNVQVICKQWLCPKNSDQKQFADQTTQANRHVYKVLFTF